MLLSLNQEPGFVFQPVSRSGFFLLFFFFSFNGVSCVNLTCLVTGEVINDCSFFFFISVHGRRRPVILFEQTFMAYVIVDSNNES